MEQVTAFRTSDGRVFLSQEEAAAHEQVNLFIEWCKEEMYTGISPETAARIILECWNVTVKPCKIWSTNDVIKRIKERFNVELSEEAAYEILEATIERDDNKVIGVTWNDFEETYKKMYEPEEEEDL